MRETKIRVIVGLIGTVPVLLSGIIMYLPETVSESYTYYKGHF